MFATKAFRPAAQLSSQVRRYASEAPKSSSNTLLYSALGAAAVGGGYYAFSGKSTAQIKDEAKNLASNATKPSGKKVFTGGDQGFIPLTLESVSDINHNTKQFRFKFDEGDAVSGLSVASALITKVKKEGDEKPTIRPYTPTSDEDAQGYLDFIIKKYPNGPMSEHLHSLKPGQTLDMKGPIPKYPWEANKHDHIALIAGGTGITPMWQLCRAIFSNPADKTKVTMIFGNVTQDDILLKPELEKLEKEYPDRFRAFYVLDNPPKDWTQGKGFITKDLLKTTIPAPQGDGDVKVFVCGPPGLYKAISGTKNSPADQGELSGYLKELGYDKSQVYKF